MEYSIKIDNLATFKGLVAIAQENDIEVCERYLKEGFGNYPFFTLDGSVVFGSIHSVDAKVVSIDKMIELLSGKRSELKLNDDYTAIINHEDEVVEVGCQKFGFDKIEELYNFIKNKP